MSSETRAQLLDVLGEAAVALKLVGVLAKRGSREAESSALIARVAEARGRLIGGESGSGIQESIAALARECSEFIGSVLST